MGILRINNSTLELILFLTLYVGMSYQEKENLLTPARKAKLFYVTTTSSTSTVSTTTICWVRTAGGTAFKDGVCKRRKRSFLSKRPTEGDEEDDYNHLIAASTSMESDEELLLTSSKEEQNEDLNRSARFALYWRTTTLTFTTTSYTSTSSLASLYCTPSAFRFSECG